MLQRDNGSDFLDVTRYIDRIRDRCELTVGGVGGLLSPRDEDVFFSVLGLRIQLLSDLLTPSPLHTADIRLSLVRTLASYKTLDVADYVEDWSVLRETLTSPDFLNTESDATQAFKRLASRRIHYKWTLTTTALLLEEEAWFTKANQWVTFDSKMNLPDLDLAPACCRGYLDFEAHYPVFDTSPATLRTAQRVAREWFDDFEWRGMPQHLAHGPGATYEVGRSNASAHEKCQWFLVGQSLRYYLDERFGKDWADYFYCPSIPDVDTLYKAQLVCVPKSPMKNRTISKEPTTLQWVQQDLKGLIVEHIERHSEIPIYLSDQEKSRKLAVRGSKKGDWDTLDLSSASDSVSCTLLEEVLGDTTLYYPLMATRSTHVEVGWTESGTDMRALVELKKFAGMGSATCFPVESIVFAIACETAIRLVSGTHSRKNDFLVYGDDIVIRHRYAAELARILREWGFLLNAEKSFTTQRRTCAHIFREACGIEALDGVDVTPLRISRRFQGCFPAYHQLREPRKGGDHDLGGDRCRESSPGVSVGQCDLANRMFAYGYTNSRRQLLLWLRHRPWFGKVRRIERQKYLTDVTAMRSGKPLPHPISMPYLVCEDGTGTNYRTRSRYNRALQRRERRFMYVVSRPRPDYHMEVSYFMWVIERDQCPNDEQDVYVDAHGMITTGSRDLKWSYGWLPE